MSYWKKVRLRRTSFVGSSFFESLFRTKRGDKLLVASEGSIRVCASCPSLARSPTNAARFTAWSSRQSAESEFVLALVIRKCEAGAGNSASACGTSSRASSTGGRSGKDTDEARCFRATGGTSPSLGRMREPSREEVPLATGDCLPCSADAPAPMSCCLLGAGE
jgi:hypothetical protein